MKKKTVIITGASGGFGKVFTKMFLQAGYHVIATIRDTAKKNLVLSGITTEESQHLSIQMLDVTDRTSVQQFEKFVQSLDSVDVLINNAGFAVAGFAEELTDGEYLLQFETNLFGVTRITNIVLPIMRRQQQGRIINISSISGLVGFPGLSPYVASKHALEGYSESLRLELKPFGIDVVLVEPGSFQTNIWSSGTHMSPRAGQQQSPYYQTFQQLNLRIQKDSKNYGNPEEVGKLVLNIARSKNTPALRYTIGKGVKLTLFLKHLLPWKLWEKLVLKQLSK
ncbi:3-oxoacyl-[acyl-carrier-protein] reductase FabG [Bacillus sp. THAF10]|uniref:SDR family oxidoreductase n=1 Tax=Bacillus sp. THAF10 TaxID=2587848 RepID=UPI0012A81620|nr:SDR family oxidoreductase [Bacillus sp. THAF10]QFT90401.1 3-oxoacyl-[acyl-carrier-protein] reductase FabG [Bacillus sp. THAF10]